MLQDHPLRYALANELHARPFPSLNAPSQALFLAIKQPQNAVKRDRDLDRAHLIALLDRFGAAHPQPDATHYFGDLGKFHVKWEMHTEFVTYTVFIEGKEQRPFDPEMWQVFPEDWLNSAPGTRVTSLHLRVAPAPSDAEIAQQVEEWFVPESLAVSSVLDRSAVIAGDFRIDSAGHMRFAVFVAADTGERRIGRVVQRICEIETYKSMSMLGLPRARDIGTRMGELDETLSRLVADMTGDLAQPEETLDRLLTIAAELEKLQSESAFRFGATTAYNALVNQRVAVLREERFAGRQTFSEFMMRRFDPAMRTVKANETRLQQITERAIRAGDLLRTRVDVDRSAQNQLLHKHRPTADLQFASARWRGCRWSRSAIMPLILSPICWPLSHAFGISKTTLTAAAVSPCDRACLACDQPTAPSHRMRACAGFMR